MLIEIFTTGIVVLRADEQFIIRDDIGWTVVNVPNGFRTDMATVPRWLRSFFPFAGAWQRAAVLHDWYYDNAASIRSRRVADRDFRRVMAQDGVGFATRWAVWAAVRCFGWMYWVKRPQPIAYSNEPTQNSKAVP